MLTDISPLLTPDALVMYPSRLKLLLLTLGASGFVALGLMIWNIPRLDARTIAVLCMGFFGFCLFCALKRLIWRKPSLIISYSGLYDGSSALGNYIVRWPEIKDVYISRIKSSAFSRRFLSIRLKDTEGFLGRMSPFTSKLMRINIGLVGAPVNISAASLSISLEELLQQIEKHIHGERGRSVFMNSRVPLEK